MIGGNMKKNKLLITIMVLILVLSLSLVGCENNVPNDNNTFSDNTQNEPIVTNDTDVSNDVGDNNAINNSDSNDVADDTTVDDSETNEEVIDDGIPTRDMIPEEYQWDLTTVYENTEAFMADVEVVKSSFDFFDTNADVFTETYDDFISNLTRYQEVRRTMDTLYVFATLQAHTDTSNTDFSDLEDIAAQLDSELSEATSHFLPAISNLDPEILNGYMSEAKSHDYVPYVNDILKEKDHILSESEEELLAQAEILFEVPESIYDSFNYLTDLSEYLPEPDWDGFWNGSREDKKEALEAYYAKSAAGINLIAEIYESEIKKNTFFAEARNYDSALASALNIDGVTDAEYNKIFEITHNNLDKLHRWISLKKEIIGIEDEIHIYDLYTPIIDDPYAWMDYENGKLIIYEALSPLGNQYIQDLRVGFDSQWADVYTTKGKYEGGYQWGTYDTEPFVLLNFYGLMTDVSTVAHEMGHALNFKYTNDSQGYFSANVPIFNAEIASTTNESLVFEYRVANAKTTIEKQQALLNYIELIENTIFTQMIYADFEKRAYEAYEAEEPINADLFNEIMGEVYLEYYGSDFALDDMTTYQWAEIPHFYNAYYVYKYATGLSAGLAFSDNILNGSQSDVDKYLTFLAAGSSEPPLDLLRAAGIDFSTGEPLQKAFDRFEILLDEFEETLK